MLALSADGAEWSFDDSAGDQATASSSAVLPEFVLAKWANNDTPEQFVVTTEYGPEGTPRAVLSLKPGLSSVDTSLQELTLELREGDLILQRQEILVDIATPEFRAWFLRDRLDHVKAGVPAVDDTQKKRAVGAAPNRRDVRGPGRF
jgi:hypothetical protein